ncbi:hypothetical protein HFP72_14985 [Nocardiopsis sp. ARC36]
MSARDVTYNGETIEAVMVGSYTLEMHYDPPMKVSEIRAGAEDVNMLERRLLGRAEGMNEDFDGAAKEFTEVVKWDISTVSAEDLATWMEVASSLRFCAGVTEEWADHVSEYKQARRRIINRWNDEAPAHEADLEDTEVPFRFVWQQTPAEKAGEALSALKEELELEESTAYGELDSRSIEIGSDLKNGPTPEAVQRLIENGYVTWSYFNLGGDVEAMPIDADPDEMADEMVEYIADPEGYEGDITEVTAILSNIGLAAMKSQEEGSELDQEQILFLEGFYDSLEEAGGDYDFYPGVLGIANQIPENANIDDTMKETLLGALGDGILALSDNSIGGDYDLLPESIRNAVEGPDPGSGVPRTSWISQVQVLSSMMEHTNPYLQGGEQFSVNLTQSVAHELDQTPGGTEDPLFESEAMENLIHVSTRNEDANHAILTGEGSYKHPTHGLDPDMTLRGLYTFDWDDDGEAVSGLTDWIWEQADGPGEEPERAGEALKAFVELFGDTEFHKSISGTGYEIQGEEAVDDEGKTVETVWRDVSAGHLNPELAWAWSDLFVTYIDDFASPYGTDVASTGAPGVGDRDEGDKINMNPADRINFLQQIMGDGNAASRIYAESLEFNFRKIEEFTSDRDFENSDLPTQGANEAGILRGMIDQALERESAERQSRNEHDAEYQEKVTGYGIDMFGAALSEVPIPGTGLVAEALKITGKEVFDHDTYDAEARVENSLKPWEIREIFQLTTLRAMANDDPQFMDDLASSGHGIVATEGGENYIPADPEKWDTIPGTEASALDGAWLEAYHEMWGETGFNANEIMVLYTEAYTDSRGKVQE